MTTLVALNLPTFLDPFTSLLLHFISPPFSNKKEFTISFNLIIDMGKSQKPPHCCLATGDYRFFQLLFQFLDELYGMKGHTANEHGLAFCLVSCAFILYTPFLHALASVLLVADSREMESDRTRLIILRID